MARIELKHVNKVYPNKVQAVFDFNLDIGDNEFIVFVGPSGCGKSTTLRMIAGLEEISSGELYIDSELSNNKLSKDRDIAMVFQSYALYPHMTVYDNMAFGLKMRKVPKDEIDRRVKDAAKILELEPYLKRKPKALSGGQRQRVALGRSIVRNAKIFLMDEPLSNLDAKLRVQMRSEIIALHERLKTTTIYVTHDQTEAMTMATRIVVMKDGYIQQIGTPREIFTHPANKFVGSFIGSPAMNFFKGNYSKGYVTFTGNADGNESAPKTIEVKVPNEMVERLSIYEGKNLLLGIRPTDIEIVSAGEGIEVEAEIVELLGSEQLIHATLAGTKFVIRADEETEITPHQKIKIRFLEKGMRFFNAKTEKAINLKPSENETLSEQENVDNE